MRYRLFITCYVSGVIAVAIQNHSQDEDLNLLSRRQDLVSGLGSLVGGLGGLVVGVGSVLGGLAAPLLGPLVGGLVGTETGTKTKKGSPVPAPAPASAPAPGPQVIVVTGGASPYGGWPQSQPQPYPQPYPQPFPPAPVPSPAPAPSQSWPSWFGGGNEQPSSKSNSQIASPPAKMGEQTVTIGGINVPCRMYPDEYVSNPSRAILLSSPAKIDAVCWSGSTPGTTQTNSGPSKDDGWLMTKSNCFIKVSEVAEYRDYKRLLKPCQEVRHWVGKLGSQYSRKDCYYCPSLSACGSENLDYPPYADLLCYTTGDSAGGNTTWYKNAGKNCFFPGAVFEPDSFVGTPGGRC